jgi:hypothetical protein
MRELSAAGKTRKQAAEELSLTKRQIDHLCAHYLITFPARKTMQIRPNKVPHNTRMILLRRAKSERLKEIALARSEAATAPPYRSGILEW